MADEKDAAGRNASEDIAELFAAAGAVVNAFAKEVRERNLCPKCASEMLSNVFYQMEVQGAIRHREDYPDEAKKMSPFFTDKPFETQLVRVHHNAGRA